MSCGEAWQTRELFGLCGALRHPLVDVDLNRPERLLMTIQRHAQRGPHAFGSVQVHNETLRDFDRVGRLFKRTRIQAEVEHQFFWRVRDLTEVRVQRLQAFRFGNGLRLLLRTRFCLIAVTVCHDGIPQSEETGKIKWTGSHSLRCGRLMSVSHRVGVVTMMIIVTVAVSIAVMVIRRGLFRELCPSPA